MKEITPKELKKMLDEKSNIQLIDVREPHEIDIASIGGELIPMGEVMSNLDKISKDKQVVIYCRSGRRSGSIVQALEQQGYTNLYNLQGGILQYADEVDNTLAKY